LRYFFAPAEKKKKNPTNQGLQVLNDFQAKASGKTWLPWNPGSEAMGGNPAFPYHSFIFRAYPPAKTKMTGWKTHHISFEDVFFPIENGGGLQPVM